MYEGGGGTGGWQPTTLEKLSKISPTRAKFFPFCHMLKFCKQWALCGAASLDFFFSEAYGFDLKYFQSMSDTSETDLIPLLPIESWRAC